jgi:putative transposase
MPSKFTRKRDIANATYHVYNRGAFGNDIFFEQSDYLAFRKIVRNTLKIYNGEVILSTFALLPNHYHFLITQKTARLMSRFMQSIGIKYSMYLRRHYGHSGRLFEGPYKAVLLRNSHDIIRVHEYISDNPITSDLHEWPHVGTQI